MTTPTNIKFHNVLPTREMIERASESGEQNPTQLEMAKAVLEFVSTPAGRTQFGDPEEGSTLEQIWRLRLSSAGVRLVCLVVEDRDDLITESIPTVIPMSPQDLVDILAGLLAEHPNTSVHPFVFDGTRGYAVTLLAHHADSDAFTIIEPAPDESRIGTTRTKNGSWAISTAALAEVVCALFLPPSVWADLKGTRYAVHYSDLQKSEFWSFFGLREIKRQPIAQEQTVIFVEPGGFKNENRLQLRIDKDERIRGGVLLQARPWLMNESVVNPFAVDLAKSFVQALTPDPDDTSELVRGLWALKSMDELTKLGISPSSETGRFLQAYVGAQAEAWILKDFVRLQVKTIALDGIKFMQLQIDHG